MTRIDVEAKSDRELLIMMNQQLAHHSEKHEELKTSLKSVQSDVHKLQQDLYARKGLSKAWALIVSLFSLIGVVLAYNK
jgi:chromosome segregation ATPase